MRKDIKGYSGMYEIHSDGRVFSLKRNKYLKTSDNGSGYIQVTLSSNSNRKTFYIHRLVAEYFCKNKRNCNEVNHLDGNKSNNNYTNLEWCTRSENIIHAIENGLKSYEAVSKAHRKRLINKNTGEVVNSIKELSERLNKSHSTISSRVVKGKWDWIYYLP